MNKLIIALTVLLVGGGFGARAAQAENFGGGDISYRSTTFSHSLHVGDFGFECGTCHGDLFAMEAGEMTGQPGFSMAAMYDGEYCGACHDGSMAFAADGECTACHEKGGEVYYDEPVKSVLFSHQVHVAEMGFGCESCHRETFVMDARAAQKKADFDMQALYDGKYCGTCHDGSMAFASDTRCASCHVGVKGYRRAHNEGSESRTAQAAH